MLAVGPYARAMIRSNGRGGGGGGLFTLDGAAGDGVGKGITSLGLVRLLLLDLDLIWLERDGFSGSKGGTWL